MVRGTNKRIIEINDTQNPYFERAVLYLKDSQADSCKKTLESQAQHFLGSIRAPLLHRRPPGFCATTDTCGRVFLCCFPQRQAVP